MQGKCLFSGFWRVASARDKLAGDIRSLVAALRLLLQHIGEEEQLQHEEDDEQLYYYHCPQHLSDGHATETVGIEVIHLI